MKATALPSIDFRAVLRDFQNLNPRDVGAWPVAPRLAALLGLFVAILLAGWWFVWLDQWDALTKKQQTEERLR